MGLISTSREKGIESSAVAQLQSGRKEGLWRWHFPFYWKWIEDGTWARLTPTARRLLLVLLLHADRITHVVCAAFTTLAEEAGICERSARSGLQKLREEGLVFGGDAGFKAARPPYVNVKRKVLVFPKGYSDNGKRPRYFNISGAIILSGLPKKRSLVSGATLMTDHEVALYPVLRGYVWTEKVDAFWQPCNAGYREKEFYPNVANLDADGMLGFNAELGKPFIKLTRKIQKNLGLMAGLYPHDPFRRNKFFKKALEGLDRWCLVKVIEPNCGGRLIFPLPMPGIWGQ